MAALCPASTAMANSGNDFNFSWQMVQPVAVRSNLNSLVIFPVPSKTITRSSSWMPAAKPSPTFVSTTLPGAGMPDVIGGPALAVAPDEKINFAFHFVPEIAQLKITQAQVCPACHGLERTTHNNGFSSCAVVARRDFRRGRTARDYLQMTFAARTSSIGACPGS